MKVAVIGAGAMGGLFGARMAEAGQDVTLLDVDDAHLRAMAQHGLLLETDEGTRRVPVRALRPEAATGTHDLLIVFTKGPATEAAVRAAAHLHGPGTRVLTVQNGLGNADRIRAALPGAPVHVITGMTTWPADLRGPGHVASHGHGEVRIWAADVHTSDPLVPTVADTLTAAGLHCTADPGVEAAIWEKLAFNAAMNSVCAVARLPVGPVGDAPEGRALVHAVVEEAAAVAHARNIPVDPARIHAAAAKAFAGHRDHKASMLQDVLAGRQTEIDQINGAIAEAAAALGIPTPVTTLLRDLVRLIDSARKPGPS